MNYYDFDDDILTANFKTPIVKVYSLANPILVLGRSSKIEQEVNLDFCLKHQLPIKKRYGGGCSVVIDPSNIIISVVASIPGLKFRNYFDKISQILIEAFSYLGFHGLYVAGISDLAYKNKKVAGSCLYRKKDLLYYSCSVLFNANINFINEALLHPPREPDYRQGRSHKDFLLNLNEINPTFSDINEVKYDLEKVLKLSLKDL